MQLGKLKDPALEALVKELGAQNKGLCLITSRLAVADLDGMEGDKVRSEDLGSLSPEAGAELLKARGAKGMEEELREASTEYKGHGLALTLLGGYIRKRYKGDIRQRAHIPLLEGQPEQRMMGVYERWFAGKPEIAILRLLGLFDRPALTDEIASLRVMPYSTGLTDFLNGLNMGAWNEAVTTLQDVGLLAPDENDRLDAHPLVREHFGQQLRRTQPEAWREGHRRLYVYLKKTAKELPKTVEEMAPLYAAVVHGCLAGKNQEALNEIWWKRVYRQKEYFNWKKLGAFGSEVAVLAAFFEPPWDRLAPGLDEHSQAFIFYQAGLALRALGRLSEAVELLRVSLKQAIALRDWRSAATSADNICGLLKIHGELHAALAEAQASVEFAEMGGDASQHRAHTTTLAALLHAMGRREEAAANFEQAKIMQEKMQPRFPLLYSLSGFRYCDFLLDQGRHAEAREHATQTLDRYANRYALFDIAHDHQSIGTAHVLTAQRGTSGDIVQATFHLNQAVDVLRRSGWQDHVALGLLARAALHIHTRDFAAARHDLDEALTLSTRCGFRLHEADAHLGYARLALAEGHLAPAREHLAKARSIIDATGYHRRDGELTTLESEAAAMAATR